MKKLLKSINYLIIGLDKKQIKRLTIISSLLLVSAVLEAIGISLVIPLVSIIFDPNYFSDNSFLKPFFSNKLQINIILTLVVFLCLFFVLKNLFILFLIWTQNRLINLTALEMNQKLYKTYLNSPYQFHAITNKSELYNNISHIIFFIAGLEALMIIFAETLILLCILMFLLYFEFFGTLVILLTFIIFALIIFIFSSQKLANWGKARFEHTEKRVRIITQAFSGIRQIKILNKENYFFDKFSENEKGDLSLRIKEKIINLVPRLGFEIAFVTCILSFLLYKLSFSFRAGEIITLLALYAAAFFRIFPSAIRIMHEINRLLNISKIIEKIFFEFKSSKDEDIEKNKIGEQFLLQKNIEVKNLIFKFDGEKKNLINSINLDIKFGERVGIIGKTGSGKSTFVNLISGLIKPHSGTVLIDGNDINKNYKCWQKQIGYVFPETFLLNDSIKNNIALGVKEENIDNELIQNAIKKSELFDFVDELNEKADTKIGEFGAKISSGQRQRIGIARVFYHNPKPKLLILDEATSALNLEVEKKIINHIKNLGRDITVIIVSHRESTLANCDRIFRIESGRLNQIKN